MDKLLAPFGAADPTVPPRLLDSLEVHVAALERGFNVLLLPRQVLLAAYGPPVPADVSFTHGVPEASTVSAVTFAQDRGLRRALVQRWGGKNVRGATFSTLGLDYAKEWSAQRGYPVVVKELVGENPAEAVRNVQNAEELEAAFNELRLRDESDRAPGKNPAVAGYATTRLTFEVNEEGQEIAPISARMLVELDRPGEKIRGFTIGDKVVAAVRLDESGVQGIEDVTDQLTQQQRDAMITACGSIPGLACATVDVRSGGRTWRGWVKSLLRGSLARPVRVVEVSERPRTETYASANPALSARIGQAIVDFQARVANVHLKAITPEGSYVVEIKGLRDPDTVFEQLNRLLSGSGIQVAFVSLDPNEGSLILDLQGRVRSIAAAMEMLVSGDLLPDKAASVKYLRK